MRPKDGSLLPLEHAICEAAGLLKSRGVEEFHGFALAKQLKHDADVRLLTAYGTLYRALDRMEKMGLLTSRSEDPHVAAAESRPIRRLYTLTAAGESAARELVTGRSPDKSPVTERLA